MRNTNVHTGFLLICVLLAACAPMGCEMEGFNYDGNRAARGVISSNKEWTIVAHGGQFKDIRSAIDNNQASSAVSGRQYGNAAVTLDLGRSCYFNCIAVLHGNHQDGYARQVSLSSSLDGKTYQHQKTVYGTRKVTYILLVQPIRARYIRLTAVRPNVHPWSISEIYLQ
jgi:hypothetical protein